MQAAGGQAAGDSFPREMLAGPTLDASRALLGARLVREDPDARRVGRIVEVEAYIGTEDLASHARFGPTDRNRLMFGPAGIAYVYLVYGMYHCVNVVTEGVGVAAAILIRAVEPIEGMEHMMAARAARTALRRPPRAGGGTPAPPVAPARLAAGPGLIAVAFDITRADNGVDLCDPASSLRLEPGDVPPAEDVVSGPRVGIEYAPEPWRSQPWRLAVARSPALSRPIRPRAGPSRTGRP